MANPVTYRVGLCTDILCIPQYHFDTDYDVKYQYTVFRYYVLLYLSNLLCI